MSSPALVAKKLPTIVTLPSVFFTVEERNPHSVEVLKLLPDILRKVRGELKGKNRLFDAWMNIPPNVRRYPRSDLAKQASFHRHAAVALVDGEGQGVSRLVFQSTVGRVPDWAMNSAWLYSVRCRRSDGVGKKMQEHSYEAAALKLLHRFIYRSAPTDIEGLNGNFAVALCPLKDNGQKDWPTVPAEQYFLPKPR